MFTGIIEEIGSVGHIANGELHINAGKVLQGTLIGDSIAVNGVCLTVTRMTGNGFVANVMPETLRRSNLGKLSVNSMVNLERAMAANGRFGGHIVSGHIDGIGEILHKKDEGNAVIISITADKAILDLIVEKGSIAVDGISLTVVTVTDSNFSVSLIPHTAKETTLLSKGIGDTVNLENDIVGKYVNKLLNNITLNKDSSSEKESRITMEFLAENGFR